MINKSTYKTKRLLNISPVYASVFLVIFIAISLWLILEYAAKERNRDLMNWQSRLSLLAEMRATALEDWLEKRNRQLEELASNPSLRLFLTEYAESSSLDESIIQAQQAHVRNLLRASAERFGFVDQGESNVLLNANQGSEYGLAVLGLQQQLVMSSKGFPVNIETHKDVLLAVYKTGQPQIIDLFSAKQNSPVVGYVVPVFQIQEMQSTSPVGAVMVLLNPETGLYNLLVNRQSATKTDETLLVKISGEALVYISPINYEVKLFHQLPDNNMLASSYAYHYPGGFAEKIDYNASKVLVTGRKIKNSSWVLVQKISAAEALAESNKHQRFLLTTFTVFVFFVAAAFVAIWRHSTSVRLLQLSDALEARSELLDAVTDNIQENIVLTDKESRLVFVNQAFAKTLDLTVEELKGQYLNSVLGKKTVAQLNGNANGNARATVMTLMINEDKHIYHVSSKELESGEHKNAHLYVMHDISELKNEQEKREQLSRGIISTLVKAVDLHDPYCANHSVRTREVALAIGKEMELTEEKLETLEMASLLANIGKLFVPKEILTKMDVLSDEESRQLKKHIDYALDILSDLTFNGPVTEVIAQKNERIDGKGYPKGLVGSEILLEAKILAVANAFVAMASSRAYREGRAVNEVVDLLLAQTESQYDRHIVAALFHIAENKSDWKTWQYVQKIK